MYWKTDVASSTLPGFLSGCHFTNRRFTSARCSASLWRQACSSSPRTACLTLKAWPSGGSSASGSSAGAERCGRAGAPWGALAPNTNPASAARAQGASGPLEGLGAWVPCERLPPRRTLSGLCPLPARIRPGAEWGGTGGGCGTRRRPSCVLGREAVWSQPSLPLRPAVAKGGDASQNLLPSWVLGREELCSFLSLQACLPAPTRDDEAPGLAPVVPCRSPPS
mmetsp:Transcript_67235/g.216944  ORF Transcript_67235/g.216944 Transcript_67235/m.216944 type:complete len:223 (+) Transcript_67235:144-812(+)